MIVGQILTNVLELNILIWNSETYTLLFIYKYDDLWVKMNQ